MLKITGKMLASDSSLHISHHSVKVLFSDRPLMEALVSNFKRLITIHAEPISIT